MGKKLFSKKHIWVKKISSEKIQLGLAGYAMERMKGIVSITIDSEGTTTRKDESFGVAETWMFMFDLYSPITGTIHRVNNQVVEDPSILDENTWIAEIQIDKMPKEELKELMTKKEYEKFLKGRPYQLIYPYPKI